MSRFDKTTVAISLASITISLFNMGWQLRIANNRADTAERSERYCQEDLRNAREDVKFYQKQVAP